MEGSHASAPWHLLYFLPLPQGQASLRPILRAPPDRPAAMVWGFPAMAAMGLGFTALDGGARRGAPAGCSVTSVRW